MTVIRSFNGLDAFAVFVAAKQAELEAAKPGRLRKAANIVRNEAKRVLGTYDYGWPHLANTTVARKGRDTPGVDTADMWASIEATVQKDGFEVGTNDPKAPFFELGTRRQPPRSFLAGAMRHKEAEIVKLLGEDFYRVLSGGKANE